MDFRRAKPGDISAVVALYDEILTAEEAGSATVGWRRGVYPTRETAEAGLRRGDLFVGMDNAGKVIGAAIINRIQVNVYAGAPWRYPAGPADVMVLHTLVVSPSAQGHGYGRAFVAFYEECARRQGCSFLRMDTNARNEKARAFYKRLGYEEIAIVPGVFNGIPGVKLVLLEKKL